MLDKIISFVKGKSTEQLARELFEEDRETSSLEVDGDGNYMNSETQKQWIEFLTEYHQDTWW